MDDEELAASVSLGGKRVKDESGTEDSFAETLIEDVYKQRVKRT